jgi:hypothetical protein
LAFSFRAGLLRRLKPAAVLPSCHHRRVHRVLDQLFFDMLALLTFKGPQIGAVRARLDPGQHHASLALRAAWSLDRKQGWFGGMG